MRHLIARAISLSTLFLAVSAGIVFLLLGMPDDDWWFLIEEEQYGLPAAVWIVAGSVAAGWMLAFWASGIVRSNIRAVEQRLYGLLETAPAKKRRKLPRPTERAVGEVEGLLTTQRERLKEISDKRAENQEQIVQERLVQERQRLARELHDSVSQQLFAASMLLSAMAEKERAETGSTSRTLEQVEKTVQQAQVEMRALLLHLRPAPLNDKTLSEGLRGLLRELDEKVHFTIRGRIEDVPLSKGAEDHLFRIAQETLSNALRHAQATELDLLFVERDGLAIFRVQDNGVGFRDGDGKSGSYGLRNVRERAVEIGGTCKIVSVPSQGTIVEVKLPVTRPSEEDAPADGPPENEAETAPLPHTEEKADGQPVETEESR
ncbi:Sensor protein vraS [Bhargavaea cecembensis DSE10]|uniref:histidine kinase n=1 Tax=Bhargavaea cecembensis DSE10 TaxID=1235279 RepID=M7NC49_9BACL|nr:sensor histidine kinase [Bhargavaea cecembensis]EMR06163.1 Sensor protein vraS [Bhargavaea cecembensis DSE10]